MFDNTLTERTERSTSRSAVALSTKMKWRKHAAACGVMALVLAGAAEGQESDKASHVIRTERKLALVIANYAYPLGPLEGILKDSLELEVVLDHELGFDEVVFHLNISAAEMREAVEEFGRSVGPNDLAFFFFSGRGMHVGRHNYLLAFDSEVDERFVPDKTLPQEFVEAALRQALLSVLVLDGCRAHSYKRSPDQTGWVHSQPQAETGKGILIAYGTGEGAVLRDIAWGPYRWDLMSKLTKPGLELQELFRQINERVSQETRGRQRPQHYADITAEYYFVPTDDSTVLLPSPTQKHAVLDKVRGGEGERQTRAESGVRSVAMIDLPE